MKIKSLLYSRIKLMINGFTLPFKLIVFFKEHTSIEFTKIAVAIYVAKFINMIVMFMPLKLLFVLSGSKNIETLTVIEHDLGRDTYLVLMFSILIVFYIGNVILQMYKSKLVAKQVDYIKKSNLSFFGNPISPKQLKQTYGAFCQVVADIMIMLTTLLLLTYENLFFSLYYLFVILVFSIIYEQWVFSLHKTNLINYLRVDKRSFINIVSMVMFLLLFLGILILVLSTGMHVIKAVLLLIIVRLSNASFKSYLVCCLKLRGTYEFLSVKK